MNLILSMLLVVWAGKSWKELNVQSKEQRYVVGQDSDIYTILYSRKSLLFSADGVWIKHSGSLLDVTMGFYDDVEICELVGLFILSKLSNTIHIDNIGLYGDDGLAIIRNASGQEMERTRKKVIAIFKTHGLKVTADTNLFQTDFLDATFNLNSGKFGSYRKPNDMPLYINTRSNHPPSITKQLPHMINNRIAQLSCDLESFNNAIPPYAEALRKAGHSPCTAYPMHPTTPPNRKKQRTKKRNITWFNPPYNIEVKTNIGKKFFYLINKHFPPNNRLHNICNKFNVKLSYSCMPNMACIIKNHNNKLIYPTTNTDEMPCNCTTKSECPLNGKCRIKSIVYKASITAPNIPTRHYFGLCETEFKARFYNHRLSFKDQRKMNATELSKAVWDYKNRGIEPLISWSIICQAAAFKSGAKRCNLCLAEKLAILQADQRTLLNKRSEFISKCRHRTDFKLKNIN